MRVGTKEKKKSDREKSHASEWSDRQTRTDGPQGGQTRIMIIMRSFLCHFSFGTQGPLHETKQVGEKISHFAIDH